MPNCRKGRTKVEKHLAPLKRNQKATIEHLASRTMHQKGIQQAPVQNQQGDGLIREHTAPRGTMGRGTLIEGGTESAGGFVTETTPTGRTVFHLG